MQQWPGREEEEVQVGGERPHDPERLAEAQHPHRQHQPQCDETSEQVMLQRARHRTCPQRYVLAC